VFDSHTGAELLRFRTQEQWISSMEFSPDGETLVVLGWRLHLFAAGSGEKRLTVENFTSKGAGKITFSPDGALLTVNGSTWDAASGEAVRALGFGPPEVAVVFSPDLAQVVSYSSQGAVLREGESGEETATLIESVFAGDVWAFSPDSSRLALAANNNQLFWGPVSVPLLPLDLDLPDGLASLAFRPDGNALAFGGDREILVWQPTSSAFPLRLKGFRGEAVALAFAPDGKTLFSGSPWDGDIIQWDLSTGAQQRRLPGHVSVLNLLLSQSGTRLISTGHADHYNEYSQLVPDPTPLRVWDVQTGELLHAFQPSKGAIVSAALSPDDRWIAVYGSADLEALRIVDIESGEVLETISLTFAPWIADLALHPSGRLLAYCSGSEIIVWDVLARQQVQRITGSMEYLHALAFSPNGRFLAASGGDGVLRVWVVRVDE
jgi:WD40 repeat protein